MIVGSITGGGPSRRMKLLRSRRESIGSQGRDPARPPSRSYELQKPHASGARRELIAILSEYTALGVDARDNTLLYSTRELTMGY